VLAHVGCIAGAALVGDLKAMIVAAGLEELSLAARAGAVAAMLPEGDPLADRLTGQFPVDDRVTDYIASMIITARKTR
jgi:aconitase A